MMSMDQWKKRLRFGILQAGMLAAALGLCSPCPAKASEIYYPYYADCWFQVDTMKVTLFRMQAGAGSSQTADTISDKMQQKKKKETAKKLSDKEKEKKKKKNAGTCLSKEEKTILYKVVSMECDTGYEGSLAVISCMLNRQASGEYPDDLMDVVREESQFTAYYDKETETYPYLDRKPSKECIAAVNDALEKGKRNIPSYIYYFRSSDYEYLNGYITYGQIGDNTYFYQYKDVNVGEDG